MLVTRDNSVYQPQTKPNQTKPNTGSIIMWETRDNSVVLVFFGWLFGCWNGPKKGRLNCFIFKAGRFLARCLNPHSSSSLVSSFLFY